MARILVVFGISIIVAPLSLGFANICRYSVSFQLQPVYVVMSGLFGVLFWCG